MKGNNPSLRAALMTKVSLLLSDVRRALPVGRGLSDEVWEHRHRGILVLIAAHLPLLMLVAVATGTAAGDTALLLSPVALLVVVAGAVARSRFLRSAAATLGLVSCSAILVHLAHGNIEMHFHFFVVVGVITLYQDWAPFGLAILFVVLHHGALGVLAPKDVYDHPSAWHNPWLWALIHGAFVLAASVVHVLAWRLNEDQALRDPLTRLPNRVLFADRLATALLRRHRHRDAVAVMVIDLDGFKGINDTLGHPAGDRLLVEVARRLEGAVRGGDVAARLGGDEFAVLVEDCADVDPLAIAHRVLEAVKEPVRVEGREFHITASIGLVIVDRDLSNDEVLRNADLAMYMAKAAGRGRIEVFEDAMFEDAVGQSALEGDLRLALEQGDLGVAYQPSVNLVSGEVVGVEALARWRHAERGMVPPSVFIPIAERADLIGSLFGQVLAQACRDASAWRETYPRLSVAVNVSARQLLDDELVGQVVETLGAAGLTADGLVLEVTESALVQDVDRAAETLHRLKALGVRIAIDDFGTGYSSLSYLRRFPIDILKIDKSFVDQLPGEGAALVRSIVRLGEALQLEVVGEGVEAAAQRGELERLGCHQGQGYLFTAPQPAEAITRMLDECGTAWQQWEISAVPGPRLSPDLALDAP